MPTKFSPDSLFGATVVDSTGDTIGKVDEVYLDNTSGQPEWVAVKTGLFGSNLSLVPLAQATSAGDAVTVPFAKDLVKDAPHHDPGSELSPADESDLYRYYGIQDSGVPSTGTTDTAPRGAEVGTETSATVTTGRDALGGNGFAATDETRSAGHDTSGPNTDDAMTRSKEELRVGTETREAGRARLRKYVTSENVTRTVPVSHEEVVVEREPITEANRGAALSGGDLTEEEHEVVLTEERAVAAKETVPVERVKLGTETVEGTERVQADVREEHIDLDAGSGTTTGNSRRTDRA